PDGLEESDNIANRVLPCKQHNNTIQTQGNSSVRRRAVLKSFQEKSKAPFSLFIAETQSLKHRGLNVLAMDTDRAATDFHSIQDQVIGFGAHAGGVGKNLVNIFFHWRGEGMVAGDVTLLGFVVFEH